MGAWLNAGPIGTFPEQCSAGLRGEEIIQDALRRERRGLLTTEQAEQALVEINRELSALTRNCDLVDERLRSGNRDRALAETLEETAERLSQRAKGADLAAQAEIIRALCPTKRSDST